jgi:putative DNA primase/helicase
MNLDDFIRHANPPRLRTTGEGGFLASCPCPDHGKGEGDRHQSLSICAGDAGGVVLYCHAGCQTEDVVAAFGLTMADLRGGNGQAEARVTPRPPRKIAATYKYEDEDGRPLFQVIRYQPKDFRQRRADGDGVWVWSLKGVRRVLYHLPEVLAAVAGGRPVYVCEGEKDVEALCKAGVVATCNPHGAGKWRPEYSEFLRDADVTIVQDKDEPGRQHAAAVVDSLALLAASVRVVEAAVGKDAADHLAAGKTLEEFVVVDASEAGQAAPKGSPAAPTQAASCPSTRLRLVPMADVVAVPVEWLWEARIPRGKLCVLAGDPGLGKSYLTLKMAAVISTGGQWPDGSRAMPAEVLIVSAEDDAADTIRPRLDRLGADVTRITMIDGVLIDGAEHARPFSLKMHVDLLREAIVETAAAIVIIDPLNAFLGGIDSHKAAEVRGVLSPLAHVAATTHAAILAVHHLNKASSANALYRASGSLDFVAAARLVHGVAADPEVEGRRVFVPVKCNICAMPEGIGFCIGEDGVSFDMLPVTLDAAAAFSTPSVDHEERSEREMAKDFLRDELADGPVPASALFATAKGYGYREITVRRASNDLHVSKAKSSFRGPWLWSLPKDCDAAEASQDGRPQAVTTLHTLGDSRLDSGEGMITLATAPLAADDFHPADSSEAKDGRGPQDDQLGRQPSLEASQADHDAGRGTLDAVEPPRADLGGDRGDIAADRALDPAVIDEGAHPDHLQASAVSAELFRRAVEAVVSNGAASLPLIAKKCQCDPGVAERIRIDLEAAGVISAAGGSKSWNVLISEDEVERVVAAYAARNAAELVLSPDAPGAALRDDTELLL